MVSTDSMDYTSRVHHLDRTRFSLARKVGAMLLFVVVAGWLPLLTAVCLAFEGTRVLGWCLLAACLFSVLRACMRKVRTSPPLFPSAAYPGPCRAEIMQDGFLHGPEALLAHTLNCAQAVGFKTFHFPLSAFSAVVVSSTENIRHVLDTNFAAYEKGPLLHGVFFDALGDGIFNSDGASWKAQRRASAHLFTSWQLENRMSEVFQRHAVQFNEVLREKKGAVVDIQQMLLCYTFDCIYEIAFGKAVNSLGGEQKDVDFQKAFDCVQDRITGRIIFPFWKIQKKVQMGAERQSTAALATIRNYVRDVLAERRQEGAGQSYCDSADLISLLEAQNEANRAGEGKVYNDEEIIDFITNFTIAGRDTTASAMTWAFFELSQAENSKHRAALEAEVASTDDVKDMHFAQAVFQETLRKWPSVPIDIKFCVEDDVLPCGTPVHKGEGLVYAPILHGRDPANYENPLTFDPRRWIDEGGECKRYDERGFAYPAFNAGPRTCLGRKMAAMEAKTLMAAVMAEFRITVADDFVPRPKISPLLLSVNGMQVTAIARE